MSAIFFRRQLVERPWLISLILIVAIVAWLAIGQLRAQGNPATPQPNQANQTPVAKVMFDTFIAQPTHKTLELYGRTAPNRQARLGAEIAGKIVSLDIEQGQSVKQGQVMASIDQRDLDIQLRRAEAMLAVKQKEFNAAKSLKSKGLQGEVAFATAQAALTDARATLSNAKTALRNTEVKAPFDGIVEHHFVELGDFVGIGDPIATVIDLDSLVIEADVSERYIQYLTKGLQADVRTVTGQHYQGTLRYIGRVSSTFTNTFPIEIEIDNQEPQMPAGISAEVQLALAEELAIKITAAMLALDEDGNLGVKTLQDEHVKFIPIQLVKAEEDGVWLSGLGERSDIIVLGQGFVRDGDPVIATPVDNEVNQPSIKQ